LDKRENVVFYPYRDPACGVDLVALNQVSHMLTRYSQGSDICHVPNWRFSTCAQNP